MDENIKKVAKANGKKLAFLLAASKLSEEEQQQWIALVPKMSLEQIDRLIDVLENQFCAEGFSMLDENLEKELRNVKEATLKQAKDIDVKTLKRLNTLTSKI
mgnify:CR=1 FL=1